jgi:hypothetical protein
MTSWWADVSLQVKGRVQVAPIINADGLINAGSVGLFAVGPPSGAGDIGIRRAATVKISTALQHHHSSTVVAHVRSHATQDMKKKKKRADREEVEDDNHSAPEDEEAESVTADVNKFYPMKEPPQALRCEHTNTTHS